MPQVAVVYLRSQNVLFSAISLLNLKSKITVLNFKLQFICKHAFHLFITV